MIRTIIEKVLSGGKEEYEKFFKSILKKYGVESPAELSDEDRKKFFDEVDKKWKADNESLNVDENCHEAFRLAKLLKKGPVETMWNGRKIFIDENASIIGGYVFAKTEDGDEVSINVCVDDIEI